MYSWDSTKNVDMGFVDPMVRREANPRAAGRRAAFVIMRANMTVCYVMTWSI